MSVLIGLLPFILMHALRAVVAPRTAVLVSGALAAATVGLQAAVSSAKSLSILTLLLLAAAAALWYWRPAVAERGAGPLVSGGLTLFVLAGLALGRPFSLEWARDTVPQAYWSHPLFLQINRSISLIWGLAFACLTALSLPLAWPGRRWHRSMVAVLLILAAGGFTAWYPSHAQQAARASSPPVVPAR